jgi:hypothetical protein
MSFQDVFGSADAVANDLYARAGEFAPDAVHDDLVRDRLARKTASEAPRRSSDAWVEYEDQRRRLKAGTRQPISPPQPTAPQDFSSEGVPVDAEAKKPNFSTEETPAEPAEQQLAEQPSRSIGEGLTIKPRTVRPLRAAVMPLRHKRRKRQRLLARRSV